MAWQRKIPFGYQVQNGRINCQPEEAKFVRSIFSHYLLGSSYSQIADEMARQGVRYHQHTAQWNKHMVKRILENERYLGMDGYPRLVTDEEFRCSPAAERTEYLRSMPKRDHPHTEQSSLRSLRRKDDTGYQIPWPPTLAM